MKNKSQILLIGPFPDPLGGVSIHLRRIESHLKHLYRVDKVDESPIIKKNIFNLRSLNFIKYIKSIINADLVHIHSSLPLLRLIHVLAAKFFCKKAIITIHSNRAPHTANKIFNFISTSLANKVISVSEDIQKTLQNKSVVIPAFITPRESELCLPDWLLIKCNELRRDNKKLIVTNAYRLEEYKNEDLYGFDLILESFLDENIKSNFNMIMVVSSLIDCENTYNEYHKFIKANNLEGNALLINDKISFSALLKHADISIRATNTDGDALSIRESLALNVETLASDCVARPKGTILFKTRNILSLKESLLANYSPPKKLHQSFEIPLIKIYEELLCHLNRLRR